MRRGAGRRVLPLLLLCAAAGATSCSALESFNPFGGGNKAAVKRPPGATPPAGGSKKMPKLTATGKGGGKPSGSATSTIDPAEAGFKNEIGREDPFMEVPMKESGANLPRNIQTYPETHRVVGTARTPQGPVAMLQLDTEYPIVHEGDILDSGAIVKKIGLYSVLIESDGSEVTLVMTTQKREEPSTDSGALDASQLAKNIPNLSNLGDNLSELYSTYLKSKYGESGSSSAAAAGGEQAEGESKSGGLKESFPDFLNKSVGEKEK